LGVPRVGRSGEAAPCGAGCSGCSGCSGSAIMTGVCGCSAVPVLVPVGVCCEGSSATPSGDASLAVAGVSLPPGMLSGVVLLGLPLGGIVPFAGERAPEKGGAVDSSLDVPQAAASRAASEREMGVMDECARENGVMVRLPAPESQSLETLSDAAGGYDSLQYDVRLSCSSRAQNCTAAARLETMLSNCVCGNFVLRRTRS
jgi:hypothetical protein